MKTTHGLWNGCVAAVGLLQLLVVAADEDINPGQNVSLLRYEYELACVTRGAASQSAIYWTGPESIVPGLSEIVNKIQSPWNCDPLNFASCNSWFKDRYSHYWSTGSSLAFRTPYITDYRWEKLYTYQTLNNQIQKIVSLGDSTNNWEVSISVQAEHNAHLFLCNEKTYWSSKQDCYYITLRGRNNTDDNSAINKCTGITLDSTELSRSKCSVTFNTNKEEVLGNNKWFHFKIAWDKNKKKLSVWDNGRNKLFLEYIDNHPIQLKGIHVRTFNRGLWKVHNYNYLYTTQNEEYLMSSLSTTTGEKVCLSFQYFLTPESTFVIQGPPDVEFENYIFQSDYKWHEARIITRRPQSNGIYIRILTNATSRSRNEFFAIGDMRQCDPEGDVRISKISWSGTVQRTCQLLQYPEFSLSYTSPTQSYVDGKECENGNFLPDCKQNCSTLLKLGTCYGVSICQNEKAPVCNCAAGYIGDNCMQICPTNNYGLGCVASCGKCKNRCNRVNGFCTDGCSPGYRPHKCLKTYPILKKPPEIKPSISGPRNLTFSIDDLTFSGEGNISSIYLEYREKTSQVWIHAPETIINDNTKLPLFLTIKPLQPTTHYEVRAILIDLSGESYREELVPIVVANTTSAGPADFKITEGKRDIIIDMVENDGITYEVRINEKEKIYIINKYTFTNLQPFTTYNIQIFHQDKKLIERNVTTKADAPSKVKNLTAINKSTTAIALQWNQPSQPNGIIQEYIVTFQHIHYEGCPYHSTSNLPQEQNITKERHIILENLLAYSQYVIRVQANTVEIGDAERINITTEAEDVPVVQPEKVHNAVLPYQFATEVSWGNPKDCIRIKAPITKYRIDIRGTDPWHRFDWKSNNVSTRRYVLEELIPYSQYEVLIYIQGPSGKINQSLPLAINFTTKPADPPAVKNLTAYSHGPGVIELRWISPNPPYGIIDAYNVNYKLVSSRTRGRNEISKTKSYYSCPLWSHMTCFTISEGLTANQTYKITVAGINKNVTAGKGHGTETTEIAFTAESASTKPLDLQATINTPHWITLHWKHPWLPHGKLSAFNVKAVVNITYLKYSDLDFVKDTYHLANIMQNYTFNLTGLQPSTLYNVEVNGQSSKQGEISTISHLTPTVEPVFEKNVSVVEEKVNNHTITITLPPAAQYLTQKSAAFIVVTLLRGIMPYFEDKSVFYNPEYRNEILKGIKIQGEKRTWFAAEIQLNDKGIEYMVGHTKNYDQMSTKFGKNFENHPLAPACQYQISIVAVNEEDSKLFCSYTSLEQPVQTRGTPLSIPEGNLGLLSLLLLLLIPVIIYIIYLKYKKERKQADYDGTPLQNAEHGPGENVGCGNKSNFLGTKVHYKPPIPVHEAEPVVKIEVREEQPEKSQELSSRVQINNLEHYVRSSIVSGELQRQHTLFTRGITQSCEYGRLPENKIKNRYANLAAYDASRVVLKKCKNDDFSDYINANYIDGYKAPKFYIGTQGPKPNTISDFWRMVWQEQVQIISMLTNVVESDKKKCEEYWPEACSQVTYGGINIQKTTTEVFADYTIRYFTLIHKGKKRNVQQLHFTSWPDHGVPLYPQSVATYLKKLNAAPKGSGPIVVHCSAGVGRTGTIILADINLRMAAAEGAVDVLYYLQRIREQRPNLVDNVEQYKLVLLVLLECLVEEQTGIPCNTNFEACVQDLKNNGGLDHQFLRLNRHKSIPVAGTKKPPQLSQMARHKNRNQDIVPGLLGQIPLSQASADDPTSTYVNAVSVDGFRIKNQFIATQFPLPGTVVDFWRLVYEKKITLIVVLNEINRSDKTIVKFWPTKNNPLRPLPYIEVKENQLNEYEHWNLHFLQMTDTSLQGQSRQETIRLLHYNGWHSSQNLPPSTKNLLMLWKETERLYMGKGPFLITCLDGAKACGLFIALAFLVEKVKLEHICDVCQAVRIVRQPRDQFVETQDQFEFLYRAIISFLEEFQTYANFE